MNPLFRLIFPLAVLLLVGWRYTDLPMESCAWCKRESRLNRHHLIQQAAAPDLAHVKTNLIVLCRDCHFVLGHRCNYRQYNPDASEIVERYTNTVNVKEKK